MDGSQVPILLALVFLHYCAGKHRLHLSFNRVSLEHPVRAPRRLVSSRTLLTCS